MHNWLVMGQPNKINEKHTQIMKTKNKGREKQWSVSQDKSNSTKGKTTVNKTKNTFSLKQLELLHLNITLNTSTTASFPNRNHLAIYLFQSSWLKYASYSNITSIQINTFWLTSEAPGNTAAVNAHRSSSL